MTRAGSRRRQPPSANSAGLLAVLYCRVSTEEQVQGYSLAAQERAGENLLLAARLATRESIS